MPDSPIKFESFARLIPHSHWKKLLLELDRRFESIEAPSGGYNSTTQVNPSTGAGGSGASTSTIDRIITSILPVELPDNPAIPVGALVSYRGGVVELASNTGNPANFAVGAKKTGKMLLYGSWHLGQVLLADGAGANASATLYLATGGKATDDETSIQDTNGDPVAGALFKQTIGVRLDLSGLPPFGFARCSLCFEPLFRF